MRSDRVGSSFQVFDFHSTVENTNSHHRKHVVGSVRVVVDTTKEGSSGIGSDRLLDQVCSSGVVFRE